MIRRIICIDEEKCTGCGICAKACHEGAIGIIGGKAKLLKEDYCDGMGDCLPTCPTGAITFTEREAAAYDEAAVKENMKKRAALSGGCPGSKMQSMGKRGASSLRQWPVQIKLVPLTAPYYAEASLLIAADCTAYAYADFHNEFMKDKVTLIGCPKLDGVDYSEKLSAIIKNNNVKSITILRMEVPCCGGLEMAAKRAVESSGKELPFDVVTISIDGEIL